MFILPELHDDELVHVALCAMMDVSSLPELRKWFTSHRGERVAAFSNQAGMPRFVRRSIGFFDDKTAHFHLECAVGSMFPKLPKETGTLDEALASAPAFAGHPFVQSTMGRFQVAQSKLPAKGMISILLGASSVAGSRELRIRGCKCDVVGVGPFTQVEWSISKDKIVSVEISAVQSGEVGDRALLDVESLHRQGLGSLILETDVPSTTTTT